MKVIAFHYYCDNRDAGHPPQTIEGDTVLVYSPKHEQVLELDLCDTCLGELTLPNLTALADSWGREISEPEVDTDLICPFGCNDSRPYKSIGGKRHHMTRKHPDWVESE